MIATRTTTRTVNEIANSIAYDIENNGHYKEGSSNFGNIYTPDRPNGKCCIIVNPTRDNASYEEWINFRRALRLKGIFSLVEWSDTTPTEEVIATLRNLH